MAIIRKVFCFSYRGYSYAYDSDQKFKSEVRRLLKRKDDAQFKYLRPRTDWCDENRIKWRFKVNNPIRRPELKEAIVEVDLILPSDEDVMAYKLRWT